MPKAKDPTKSAKKVRLTYCIATPSSSKVKKGMNTSSNWANKSLNKSRVLMRSLRKNNVALAKKLNEVQIELTKYEEETSALRDSLQTAQIENRTKETCLRDIYTYYDEIAHLLVTLGRRVNDGLSGGSRMNVSSYLSKSLPLNTTVTLEDAEQPLRPAEPQVHENPFIRRDKIPRTPPIGNISSYIEEDKVEEVMENGREQIRKNIRLEPSPYGRKDTRKEKSEEEKQRRRRSDRENQFAIKQISMISESPRTLDKSLEKKEQPRRSHPDVIVERMLNDLMSHGMPGSMEDDTPTFPLSPPGLSRTPVDGRRSRSLGLTKRLSSRRSSSPQIKVQDTELLAPATPDMVPEPEKTQATQTGQQTTFHVVSEYPESQPAMVDKAQLVVSNSTKKKKKKRTVPSKTKKATNENERQESESVVKEVSKSGNANEPNSTEMSQKGNEEGDNGNSETCNAMAKPSESQNEESDPAAAGRTVLVEAKKPGVLKFYASKQGEENVPTTTGKKTTKKGTRPTAKTKQAKQLKQLKQVEKAAKSNKPKSVFDFSMSDTMNKTAEALPPYAEFRKTSNEQTFVKPNVPIVKAAKVVVDRAKNVKQTKDLPEDEQKADTSPANQKSKPGRPKKVRIAVNSKPSAQPLQELQAKADDDPHDNSASLNVERLDVHAVVHADLENPQPPIDDEFQTRKTSAKKAKRRFARLITFDDSAEEDHSANAKQARLEPDLPQTPVNDDRDAENNSGTVPDTCTRSRRGQHVNYKEPGINKKVRRGDPHWCRKNV